MKQYQKYFLKNVGFLYSSTRLQMVQKLENANFIKLGVQSMKPMSACAPSKTRGNFGGFRPILVRKCDSSTSIHCPIEGKIFGEFPPNLVAHLLPYPKLLKKTCFASLVEYCF